MTFQSQNKLTVDYISDLHIDFWIKELNRGYKLEGQIKQFSKSLELFGGDVLIIAGDLGHYYVQDSAFLKYTKVLYKEVIFVYGNHDMYLISNSTKSKYKSNSMNRIKEMKEFCEVEGIHYLDGDTIEINGFLFGGVGMSSDKSFLENLRKTSVPNEEVKYLFERSLNDSRNIYGVGNSSDFNNPKFISEFSQYNPYSPYEHHSTFDQFSFFESELKKLQNIKAVDVMISHYGPCVSPDMHEPYRNDEISTFYYFDGAKEIQRIAPKYWVHGHTHKQYNFMNNNCNVLCNPLGYPSENSYVTAETFTLER